MTPRQNPALQAGSWIVFSGDTAMARILVLGTRTSKKRREIEEILGDLG